MHFFNGLYILKTARETYMNIQLVTLPLELMEMRSLICCHGNIMSSLSLNIIMVNDNKTNLQSTCIILPEG